MENEDLYKKDCIRTYSGKYVNVFEPTEDMICIEDIAHALAHQCRFAGHTRSFLSVAEHSYYVMLITSKENKLQDLMHDASEAYLVDIPSPIKRRLSQYVELEDKLMHVIASKFGFTWPMSDEVKVNDKKSLEFEWENSVLSDCEAADPKVAERLFLQCFKEITK
jgi:uncharacterized protein